MSAGPYTFAAWIRIVTAPTAGDSYQSIFTLNTNAISVFDQIGVLYSGGNTRLFIAADNGSYTESIGATNLSTNTWYHIALVRSANNSLTGYLNGVSHVTNTSLRDATAATRMDIGVHPAFSSDDFKGQIAAIKIYDAVLVAAQIASERSTYVPQRLTSINLWSPNMVDVDGERFVTFCREDKKTKKMMSHKSNGRPLRPSCVPTHKGAI